MALKDVFKNIGASPDMGLGGSKMAQEVSENLNLGKIADGMYPDAVVEKIKANAFANVIKYEGGNDTFVWKHPVEDFMIGSQLIVHQSQEAVFYMNGQALDSFGPGRYTLETQNLPLVGKFFNAPLGGETPFHCEVYFINKTEQLAVKWGTDSEVTYIDPIYNLPIQIGASGEMSVRVDDSRKLLVKIVGTEKGFTQQAFVQKMRMFLMEGIKAHLANYISDEKINIFEADKHLTKIAEALHETFKPDFLDYGVAMEKFKVTAIVRHKDESYKKLYELQSAVAAKALDQVNVDRSLIQYGEQIGKRIKDADADAYKTERLGVAEGVRLREMGISRQEEMALEATKIMAGNEAIGQMTNTGIGLGMMTGVGFGVGGAVGGMVSNQMGNAINNISPQGAQQAPAAGVPSAPAGAAQTATVPCAKCGNPLPAGAKFCLECGTQVQMLSENELICPSCGTKTPKGKFCLECGAALVKKCPSCGIEVPPNGKFCLECGQSLAGAPASE